METNSHSSRIERVELTEITEHITYRMYKNSTVPELQEPDDLQPADHEETVSQNRAIIKLAIDAVLLTNPIEISDFTENFECFHKKFEKFIRKRSRKTKDQYNKLKCVLTKDRMRSAHIEIMDCIADRLHSQIQEEMMEAHFFGVQIDHIDNDTTDTGLCAMTVRYVTKDGRLQERFFGIHDTGQFLSGLDMVELLEEELEGSCFESKLVSLAHDSLIVKDDQLSCLQSELRFKAPQALVTNAHPLSTILQQRCTCRVDRCRLFFSTIQEIPEFFKRAPLNEYSKCLVLNLEYHSEWWYHSWLFHGIVDRWQELKSTLETILTDPEGNADCVYDAKHFLNIMNNFDFTILCVIFRRVFHITDNLNYQMNLKSLDIKYCRNLIDAGLEGISSIKTDEYFRHIFEIATILQGSSGKSMTWKQTTCNNFDDFICRYKNLTNEIVDTIYEELEVRFRELEKLRYFRLADTSLFQKFSEEFPTEDLNAIGESYPTVFDLDRLRSELEMFYKDHNFWKKDTLDISYITYCLCQNKQHLDVYKETYKLFVLVLTVHFSKPYGTSRVNLQKLKSYTGCGIPRDTLCSMAYSGLNQPFCSNLFRETPNLEDIVDRFYFYTKNDNGLLLA